MIATQQQKWKSIRGDIPLKVTITKVDDMQQQLYQLAEKVGPSKMHNFL